MSAAYALLDSGNQMKLERVGTVILARPAPQAFWPPSLGRAEWDRAVGVYERDSGGGGRWLWKTRRPDSWEIQYGGFRIIVKPTDFGHLGFFPEQLDNWERLTRLAVGGVKTLNLFGYSGLSSLALARGGAEVCHVDAAKGMVDWGRAIHALNPNVPDAVRWIVDDVRKFVAREIRRGSRYEGIVLDPPSFGRGPKGQIWKIEDDLLPFLRECRELMGASPRFALLTAHSPGYTPLAARRVLAAVMPANGCLSEGEMTIAEGSGARLPAGVFALWEKRGG